MKIKHFSSSPAPKNRREMRALIRLMFNTLIRLPCPTIFYDVVTGHQCVYVLVALCRNHGTEMIIWITARMRARSSQQNVARLCCWYAAVLAHSLKEYHINARTRVLLSRAASGHVVPIEHSNAHFICTRAHTHARAYMLRAHTIWRIREVLLLHIHTYAQLEYTLLLMTLYYICCCACEMPLLWHFLCCNFRLATISLRQPCHAHARRLFGVKFIERFIYGSYKL